MAYSALLSMLKDTGQTERAYGAAELGSDVSREDQDIQMDAVELEAEIKRIERAQRSASSGSGVGRLLGTALMAPLGPIGMAAGSYIGSEIGSGGNLNNANVNLSQGLFGKTKRMKMFNDVNEVQSMVREANDNRKRQAFMSAIGDAVTGSMLTKEFGIETKGMPGGGKIGNFLSDKFPGLSNFSQGFDKKAFGKVLDNASLAKANPLDLMTAGLGEKSLTNMGKNYLSDPKSFYQSLFSDLGGLLNIGGGN